MVDEEEVLEYHSRKPPGKIKVSTTKPTQTQRDLSLAYTPGVAIPCEKIADDIEKAYDYTAKSNLVGVVTNGTAVLGLGDIGAQASKPVMEGKGVLFKRFADIDVFDIELNATGEELVESVKAMEPTFGGINLEDIKAPECFVVEEELREALSIPVFHDDQHGTAIISGAALLNACEIADKDLDDIKIVFSGAGASAIATAQFFTSLGVKKENIVMCDSSGIITQQRVENGEVNKYKAEFAPDIPEGDLKDAMEGSDVFVGLSIGGIVDEDMVRSMNSNPIVFAMANPEPEIGYYEAKEARDDKVIVATGRSDFPNQVNNVLGFPFIFRGALDVRATEINEEMKVAAAEALAELAKEDVPDEVMEAYGERLQFGPDYLIPKPLDPRVLFRVAPSVANAAIESGAARRKLEDIEKYREELEARLGKGREMMRVVLNKAKSEPKKIALAEGENEKVVRAAYRMQEEEFADPVLIGNKKEIIGVAADLGLEFEPEVIDPANAGQEYTETLYKKRQRKGVTKSEAEELIEDPNYFGSVVVEKGEADALLTGLTHHYPSALRPPLEIIGTAENKEYAAGVYMLAFEDRVVFIADATVNLEQDEKVLSEVARHTAELARRFNVEPRVAFLSYSDFGSVENKETQKPKKAANILREDPSIDFPVDGEMQADTAVVEKMLKEEYSFCELEEPANVLVFPNLDSGNISYKLLQRLGGAEAIGPMLVGMAKPVHVLQRGDDVQDIVNLAAVAVVDAQDR